MSKVKRAVGLIRVSRINGRDKNDALHSPGGQRERIEGLREAHGWRLVDVLDENEGANGGLRDASGAKAVAERPKLREAVERIEAGRADVLVVAWADRLTWTQAVRDEVLSRVEAVGGEVWAADNGRQSNATAVDEFSGTTLTAAARYLRRQAAEKAREAQVEAVAAGTWMAAHVPPGYRLGADRRLTPDPETEPVVVEAFKMRAEGASIESVRLYLAEHGIERTSKAVAKLLGSRVVLGELHFGKLPPNLSVHPAIVDRELWERVQRASAPRGRQAKSERLLARLGVLRCGCCGSRMSVTASNYRYPAYRCGQAASCERRQTIAAPLAEGAVVEYVKDALAGITGTASAVAEVNAAATRLDEAHARYDAALRAFDGHGDEQAAIERLGELRDNRDAAQERYEDARGSLDATQVAVSVGDWEDLSLDGRRDLIRAVIERVEVRPGRGRSRIEVTRRAA
jgi:site-specific DNA recombinase